MKKIFFSLCMVLVALTANAQIRLGVKGGVDLAKLSFKNDVFKSDNRTGWFIGPTMNIPIPLPGMSIDLAALYNQRESKIDVFYAPAGTSDTRQVNTLKTKQIIVPMSLRYSIYLGTGFNVFAFGGPQLGFAIGDKEQNLTDDNEAIWRLKNSAFSVNVGAGITLANFQLSANYNVGVSKTGEVTWKNATQAAADGWNGNYNSWQVSAAYYF
ncbi:MAG: porin family protein, partial [Prevotella sp.]|nr:porin family protein [Prevotella sp.]